MSSRQWRIAVFYKVLPHWLGLSLSCGLGAVPLSWEGPEFFLVTRGMALSQLLADLGANYGVPVVVSGKVTEVFVGRLKQKQPEEILQELASLFRLTWYFDGHTLYVYKANEVERDIITPQYVTADQLNQYLKHAEGMDASGGSLQPIEGFNAFEVVGPPAFIERVKSLVKELDQNPAGATKSQEVFRVFPLKYATAEDQSYEYGGKSVTLPGVVTLLNQMLQLKQEASGGEEGVAFTEGRPSVTADARTNAVVIWDKEVKLDQYAAFIKELDQPQKQVEISVSIIDLDSTYTRDLGAWLGFDLGSRSFANGKFSLNTAAAGSHLTTVSEATNAGLRLSGKIGDTASFDLFLHALEEAARAKVLAQPSILTLNNHQAVLDKSTTFYTEVHTRDIAKIEPITSGTLLEVTPRLLEGETEGEICLQIHLKDGRMEQLSEDNEKNSRLPQTQSSEVFTQAILKPGEALLLGGFLKEEQRNRSNGIPYLSKIPVLGKLFSATEGEENRVIRLFYIKANPVEMERTQGSCGNTVPEYWRLEEGVPGFSEEGQEK